MTRWTRRPVPLLTIARALAPLAAAVGVSASPAPVDLDLLLTRTGEQVAGFLAQLSDVQCVEEVLQEKLGENEKVLEEQASTYHYLILLNQVAGALTVDESRQPVGDVEAPGDGPPMLVSNGFAMLFLIFHPHYAVSFHFEAADEDVIGGRRLQGIAFRHVPGTRSPAALELRGRDYPLELSGIAWIDPASGAIARIVAGVDDTMADVGLRALRAEARFAPAPFPDLERRYWFPVEAEVEVETPRQHWRNTHRFKDYRRFSVTTEEQVSSK